MKKTLFAIAVVVIAMIVGSYQFGFKRGFSEGAKFTSDKMHIDQLTRFYEDQCKAKGATAIVNNRGYLNCRFPDGTEKTIWSMFE